MMTRNLFQSEQFLPAVHTTVAKFSVESGAGKRTVTSA
jgi:hypothetical protein